MALILKEPEDLLLAHIYQKQQAMLQTIADEILEIQRVSDFEVFFIYLFI